LENYAFGAIDLRTIVNDIEDSIAIENQVKEKELKDIK